jgi:hypothetical protein
LPHEFKFQRQSYYFDNAQIKLEIRN